MDRYQQLEAILNKCIEKWWKPMWDISRVWKLKIKYDNIISVYMEIDWMVLLYDTFSIHDLFSKDSWLMEFVEWKIDNSLKCLCLWNCNCKNTNREAHMIIMCTMTADEKIDYFLDNTVL
jgi:hypothetical protein